MYELADRILRAMAGAVTIVDEVHGFRYFDNRDLLGFVDGTENPDGPLAVDATAVGDEDPDFAGSCYVHVQKYVHDMSSWNSLSVAEQELVIGRTKLEDIELDDDDKPANTHIALNVIADDDGTELKIVRHNVPFGELGKSEYGTYFIGYSGRHGSPSKCSRTCSSATHRQHRSHPGLLHRGHRRTVLLPHRRLSRRPHRPCPRHSRQRGR